jgi:hypothetical protein
MKYLLALLLLSGCTNTPTIAPVTIPGEYVEEVTLPPKEDIFVTETDIRMCIENPDSPWCVIECELYVQVWCE